MRSSLIGTGAIYSVQMNGCDSALRSLRCEYLNEHLFGSLAAAEQIIEARKIEFNTKRPHTSQHGLSPSDSKWLMRGVGFAVA